jgi:hypothetical protein
MRNLLALLGLALVLFLGVGWYMGWYKIKTGPNVSIDIDAKKVRHDVPNLLNEGKEKMHQLLDSDQGEPAKAGKDQPGKSSAVRAAPDMTGFPFDAPGAKDGAHNPGGPTLRPSLDDAPIPGAYYKPNTAGAPATLSVPSAPNQGN